MAPLYIYGVLLCAFGVSRIYRSIVKYKVIGNVAGFFGACFLPLLGVVLLPPLICKKKMIGIVFAIAGTVFYALSYLQYFNIFSSAFLGTFCYLAALACFKEKSTFSWKFMAPVCIAVTSYLFLTGYNFKLQHDIQNYRDRLSQIIGRSVKIEDFWHREQQGFPLDREPLKSLIANHPQNSYPDLEYNNAQTAQKKLLEYNKKYPGFVKSLDDFLQLPESHVAHKKAPENELLYSVSLPELRVFREAARYLAMKIAAKPDDKLLVKKCNNDLIKLRNWPLQNEFFISYLVATSIEAIRLKALSAVLSNGTFSQQEFTKAAGAPVDWNKYVQYTYGAEATAYKNAFDNLQAFALWQMDDEKINVTTKYMPLFINVHFLRDYRFALQSFIKYCTVPADLSGLEKAKFAEVDMTVIKNKFYALSGMLLPSLENAYIVTARIMNIHQMALVAAEVMEYRKRHGSLPENLAFLPKIPLSKLDHKPLMYEKTSDGFRIYSYTQNGKKPDAKDTNYSYFVQLPEIASTKKRSIDGL